MLRYDDDYPGGSFEFTRPNQDVLFTESSSVGGLPTAIKVAPTARSLDIVLAGTVTTSGFGIQSTAHETSITIRGGGTIDANIAVSMTGAGHALTNAGSITGNESGVVMTGSGSDVSNGGEISGRMAVCLRDSDDGRFLNGANGQVMGAEVGVVFDNAYVSSENTLVNRGSILSPGAAFQGSATVDRVINRGMIDGDVILGEGDDLFDGRQGETLGQVHGGVGNDTYIVDDAGTPISELANGGGDKVRSSVDYRLFDNFDILVLTGRDDTSGWGNDESNNLIGNTGDNILYGLGGRNMLAGGGGDDRLLGGADQDVFVFGTGDDRDTIGNFEDGVDLLDLRGWKGMSDLGTFLAHAEDVEGNLVVSYRGDVLVIENTDSDRIDASDFGY